MPKAQSRSQIAARGVTSPLCLSFGDAAAAAADRAKAKELGYQAGSDSVGTPDRARIRIWKQ